MFWFPLISAIFSCSSQLFGSNRPSEHYLAGTRHLTDGGIELVNMLEDLVAKKQEISLWSLLVESISHCLPNTS